MLKTSRRMKRFASDNTSSRLRLSLIAIAAAAACCGPVGAAVIDGASTAFTDDGKGLLIGASGSLDAGGRDLTITGILSEDVEGAESIEGNGAPFYTGLQINGKLSNAGTVTTDTILNYGGSFEADSVVITKTGVDAFFMNYGENAQAVINGSISVDTNGWVNNTQGAVMTLNGDGAVIDSELANDYGSTLNINGDTTIKRSLHNVYGGVLNIADGVTVSVGSGMQNGLGASDGTIHASGATININPSSNPFTLNYFTNRGDADIGTLTATGSAFLTNNGNMRVNHISAESTISNSGSLTVLSGAMQGRQITNSGTIYAPAGALTVDGTFIAQSGNALMTSSEEMLRRLETTDTLTVNQNAAVEVSEEIHVPYAVVSGTLKTGKLVSDAGMQIYTNSRGEASYVEVDEIELGAEYETNIGKVSSGSPDYGNAMLVVHNRMKLGDGAVINNYGQLLFNDNAVIEGNASINNTAEVVSNPPWPQEGPKYVSGVIAQNENLDPIENLTIEGELHNEGRVYVTNLAVKSGVDQDPTASYYGVSPEHAFEVANLTILSDGDFSLNSEETTLSTITLEESAKLNAAETNLTLENSAAITAGSGSSATFGSVSARSLSVSLDGGAVEAQSLPDTKSLTLTFNQIEGSSFSTQSMPTEASTVAIIPESENNQTPEALIQAVSSSISGIDDYTIKAEPGEVADGFTTNSSDFSTIVRTPNPTVQSLGTLQSISLLQWRHEMNNLSKRMGELRDGASGIGSWVRLYGSEQEHRSVTMKNTSVQVGVDADIGAGWKIGAAFAYTDGSSDLDNGDADHDAWSGALYGTWLGDNGLYVDLVAKYSRLSTDFNLSAMNGSFDSNAWSASAELGWHLPINEIFFVEPQLELTYGQASGDTIRTSTGVKLDFNDFTSFIGRAGLRVGVHFPENRGVIYARVSGLYDFDGDTAISATKGVTNRMTDDLGGGWVEYAVGANFSVTDRDYLYLDLERTNGGDVVENWRWNVGFRHVW